MHVDTRWMKRTDLAEAVRIASACGLRMDERLMDRLVSKTGVVCMVAELEGRVVGLLAYDISRVSKIKVIVLAVESGSRRKGVGRELVDLLTAKLNGKRNKIELSVSEYSLDAQLFLRAMGFKAVSIHDAADGSSDYRFVYKREEPAAADF